jgi:hypothetical protein
MKRTDYETLAMEEIIVEMENGFLGGSADVQNPDTKEGRIDNQKINNSFNLDGTDDDAFADGGWK